MKQTAKMVDISKKPIVRRVATAEGTLHLQPATVSAIKAGRVEKGDVLEIARVAAIQAAKATPQLLPLTHPIPLEGVEVDFQLGKDQVTVSTTVRAEWRTGVEMEALAAATVALLTVWDLVKPLEKDAKGQYPGTRIDGLRVTRKVKG